MIYGYQLEMVTVKISRHNFNGPYNSTT